jgi:hypothetical protein
VEDFRAFNLLHLVDELLNIPGLDDRPIPRFGEVLVIIGDVARELLLQVSDGREVPTFEDMRGEDTEPDLDGVQPTPMLGGIQKADTMLRITQVGLSAGHVLEDTSLAFLPEVLRIPDALSHISYQCFALVRVELVAEKEPGGLRSSSYCLCYVGDKVGFGPSILDGRGEQFPSCQMQVGCQHLRPMPDVVEFPPPTGCATR